MLYILIRGDRFWYNGNWWYCNHSIKRFDPSDAPLRLSKEPGSAWFKARKENE